MDNIVKYIQENINPKVQADGGFVTVKSISEEKIIVQLSGECSRCPISKTCLRVWIQDEIKQKFGLNIQVEAVSKPPYFWDNV